MAACTNDAQCRTSEGYVCDPSWHACVLPNVASIVPRECPAPRGIGRNPAFAPTETVAGRAAALADGKLVTLDKPDASLAHDANGFYATWIAEKQLVFATSKDGVEWSPTTLGECDDCRPMVLAGGIVVSSQDGVQVRRNGVAVTAAAGYGSATLGGDGRVHVVANDGGPLGAFGSANQRIVYTVSDGRAFKRPVVVSKSDEILPFYFAMPAIAVDSRRKTIFIAYVRGGRDAVWDIMLASSKDGVTWTRTRIGDDPPCAIHMVPNLAVDSVTGMLHVTWYDTRGGGRFAHATCLNGKCTQVGRINDQPFGPITTVRRSPHSIADTTTLLVDEKRRTLDAIWTQPVENAVQIYHARAKLR
jgi:hypothetical protein